MALRHRSQLRCCCCCITRGTSGLGRWPSNPGIRVNRSAHEDQHDVRMASCCDWDVHYLASARVVGAGRFVRERGLDDITVALRTEDPRASLQSPALPCTARQSRVITSCDDTKGIGQATAPSASCGTTQG